MTLWPGGWPKLSTAVTTSLIYFFACADLGLVLASLGPSILALQSQTNSSPHSFTFVFTVPGSTMFPCFQCFPLPWGLGRRVAVETDGKEGHVTTVRNAQVRSLGYLLGAFLGGLLLDWRPRQGHALLSSALLLSAAATALIPAATHVWSLGALVSLQGGAMGVVDTAGNCLLIYLWEERVGPWMQAMHFCFGVGAFFSPLTVRAAMAISASGTGYQPAFWVFALLLAAAGLTLLCVPSPRPSRNSGPDPATPALGSSDKHQLPSREAMHEDRWKVRTSDDGDDSGLQEEEGGLLLLPPASDSSRGTPDGDLGEHLESQAVVSHDSTSSGLGAGKLVSILALTAALLGLAVGAETGFGGFLLYYAHARFGMSEAQGQYLTSGFWGSLAAGRFLAIPLSLTVAPAEHLVGDLAVTGASTALLLAFGGSRQILWAASAGFGLGLASMFPTVVSLVEEFVDVTGRISSVFVVGAAAGEMAVPLAIGIATGAWPPAFVALLAATVAAAAVVAILLWLVGSSTPKYRDIARRRQDSRKQQKGLRGWVSSSGAGSVEGKAGAVEADCAPFL